jgi:hypothetical protein
MKSDPREADKEAEAMAKKASDSLSAEWKSLLAAVAAERTLTFGPNKGKITMPGKAKRKTRDMKPETRTGYKTR